MPLLASRRLSPLLVTQTLGALNDNLFKNALVVLILFRAEASAGPALVAVAGGVFILPYMLFSATAGRIADRFDKSRTMLLAKLAEVVLMAAAAAGFLGGSTPLLFAVLFGLGVQATVFSPLKYAILPAHLAPAELVAGNGLVEAGTFIGILAGTVAGSALFSLPGGPRLVSAAGIAVALAGLAAAALIRPAPPITRGPPIGWNLWADTVRLLATARANRPVWLCILGLSWFWNLGAVILAELPTLVRDTLGAAPEVFTLLLAFFSVGIGAGSLLCSRLLGGEVSPRFVPLAAVGLSLFLADFALAVTHAGGLGTVAAVLRSPAGWRMLADLALLSGCGGLFSVPLYATIQHRAAPAEGGSMIAANNVVNAAVITAGAIAAAALALAGLSPAAVLMLAAAANAAVALWIVRILPPDTVRAGFRWCVQSFHGVDLRGIEHLPAPGQRAVVVANPQGLLDGCFAAAVLPGAPVLAVDVRTASRRWTRPLLAAVRNVVVDPANPFSTRTMTRAVERGQTLVIVPEGRLTISGALAEVYEAAAMIADNAGAVLIPLHIDGVRRSRLGRVGGRAPRRLFPRLSLTALPPVTLDPTLAGRSRRHAAGLLLQSQLEPRPASPPGSPSSQPSPA